MARYKQEVAESDGWTDLIIPTQGVYKMSCCDCGLVHDLQFKVVQVSREFDNGKFTIKKALKGKKMRAAFRARRNNRATGQVRRRMKSK